MKLAFLFGILMWLMASPTQYVFAQSSASSSIIDGYYRQATEGELAIWADIKGNPQNSTIDFFNNACSFSVKLIPRDGFWDGYLGDDFDGVGCAALIDNLNVGDHIMIVNPTPGQKEPNGRVLSFTVHIQSDMRNRAHGFKKTAPLIYEFFGTSGYIYEAEKDE